MVRDQLIRWLNDAYAMEQAMIPVLENHAKDARAIPEVMSRDLQHAEETRVHAERVRQCLQRLGTTPSTMKSAIGTITGNVQSVATGLFGDELIKNALTDYSTEHFEIAAYRALIEAAEEAGHSEIVPLLKDNLREEQAMAQWLQDRLPELTRQTIARETAAH